MAEFNLDKRCRNISYRAISDMLDNPNESGIYPTTQAYERIDKEIKRLLRDFVEEVKPERSGDEKLVENTMPGSAITFGRNQAIDELEANVGKVGL